MSEAEGDKLWKAAKKYTSPSVLSFRMKSDWEQAGPLYEKAATCFRVSLLYMTYACLAILYGSKQERRDRQGSAQADGQGQRIFQQLILS